MFAGGRGHLWVFNCNTKILDTLLYHSAIPMFQQEGVIDRNRTPPAREKQGPKCTADAVDTRSVPRASGLVLTGLSESDRTRALACPGFGASGRESLHQSEGPGIFIPLPE